MELINFINIKDDSIVKSNLIYSKEITQFLIPRKDDLIIINNPDLPEEKPGRFRVVGVTREYTLANDHAGNINIFVSSVPFTRY